MGPEWPIRRRDLGTTGRFSEGMMLSRGVPLRDQTRT